MIKIILCDDNQEITDLYEKQINDFANRENYEISIYKYRSGEQLLFNLSEDVNFCDIIFLDVEMNKINGLDVGRKLREMGCLAQILYLSSSEEYVFEAFDVEPFYYIVKNSLPIKKFYEILSKVFEVVLSKQNDYIVVQKGTKQIKLFLNKIYYIEVNNKLVSVHTVDGQIEFYGTLATIADALKDKDFVRIYRSIIVNCDYIERLIGGNIVLTTGQKLPVSRTYYSEVHKFFSQYLLDL